MRSILEIAVNDLDSARIALHYGADRIELCSALGEGGLTPSAGVIRTCLQEFPDAAIFPIIRPRTGHFIYSHANVGVMREDIRFCRSAGCKGIVVGALGGDGEVWTGLMKWFMEDAGEMEVTFHRAFDRARDPFEALEQIIALGCKRILTSGQQPDAMSGAELIRQLNEQAAGRIIIMPGAGVTPNNIKALKAATGCQEFHAAVRTTENGWDIFIHPNFQEKDYEYPATNALSVQALREALDA